MNIVLFGFIIVYIVGVISTMIKFSNWADKANIDNAFFAIGAIIVSFTSWIGFYLFIKNYERND